MSDPWRPDQDEAVARIEGRLSDALTSFLYGAHRSAHVALGLPKVEAQLVQAAYRLPVIPVDATFAKADEGGWSKAAQLFAELQAQPRRARSAGDLARSLTESWYERGLIDHHAQRATVQANLVGRIRAGQVDFPAPWTEYQLSRSNDGALTWAQERACRYARGLKDQAREALHGAVLDALLRGDSAQTLAVDITHRFGVLNRDARRLAITEVSFARSNGFLSAVPPGEQVDWFAVQDACAHCQKLHGRRFTVSAGPADPEQFVWVGKHNVGLGASARTASIPLHPHCRCRWVRVSKPPVGVSARLRAVLDAVDELGQR